MQLKELDYDLPKALIADRPAEPREKCRLMVIHRLTGRIEHRCFTELGDYLHEGDLLVLNSARVIPARCYAFLEDQPGIHIEILALDPGPTAHCQTLLKPSRKIRARVHLLSAKNHYFIRVMDRNENGSWILELEEKTSNWMKFLEEEGEMPLPHYILKRRPLKSSVPQDRYWYQTAYADREGAIAAPTAGLHFSIEMLNQFQQNGIDVAKIFLKIGMGTFQPIRTSTVEEHILSLEEYEINQEATSKIHGTKSRRGRVIAVGTTVVRSLEFCASKYGRVLSSRGNTNLLISPPYSFRTVDALITNFHLPKTTLLALVYAFGGTELIRKAYREAIRTGYRFYSYGDAMLIR